MTYSNSLLINLYAAGLYETFCFVDLYECYILRFTFKKDSQPQKVFDLIMENL